MRSDHSFTSVTDGQTDEGGLLCVSDSKESACIEGDPGSIPGLGRSSGERNGNPLQYSGLENGQRSLVGYSPWGLKESDRTEGLRQSLSLSEE